MSNTNVLNSDTAPADASGADSAPRRRAGLSGMVLAELRELAGQLGITGTTGMRKGDLIAAIKERQGGQTELPVGRPAPRRTPSRNGRAKVAEAVEAARAEEPTPAAKAESAKTEVSEPSKTQATGRTAAKAEADSGASPVAREATETRTRRRRSASRPAGSPDAGNQRESADEAGDQEESGVQRQRDTQQATERTDRREQTQGDRPARRPESDRPRGDRPQGNRPQGGPNNGANNDDDDDERGGRRGRRFRDRRRGDRGGRTRGDGGGSGGGETEIREDDVLLPVGGILDVLENYAFVRTSGYLAGPNDVYVSLSLVRKYGLRRGDAVTGVVRQPREGEQQRQKFNPLVRVDKINGLDPDGAKQRPEFTKMTPLYPNERLRLETEPHVLTTRVIDLVMPVGKGQRALIVSPPKAGKTMVLQSIANAITKNNPECHLMVVLIDERPEEVTDMQRSVKGEVIASTFDRPPSDHTTVAELAIERAKRLVEMGHDVVVLLDSITRLGRAYNLAAPASGRILSGGVDSTALFPPKRFLGAARNIENGGSLTVFATALVETGSAGDTVIFEEFKGTGNAELKLDRKIADKRVFPAVDVDQSSTRKEELLLSPDELAVTHKLRRVLHALDSQQAIDLLLDRLRKSKTNIEFLMQVAKTTPSANGDD